MLAYMNVCGQEFSEEIIGLIRETVRNTEDVTRGSLARMVCGLLDWRHQDGRPKETSCRVALGKLDQRGVIELPEAKAVDFRSRNDAQEIDWPKLKMPLSELGEIKLVLVGGRDKALSRLWWQMMKEHHPLGGGPLVGAQLRYLVKGDNGWLGGLSFSAAAWRLQARDEWIGWDEQTRYRGLSKIVGNSRFLILPTVEVPNLASHILGLALKRLPKDWQKRYGSKPVLVETFVDTSQYQGTCYQAANWIEIGLTKGRGRQDRTNDAKLARKKILVYPLQDDWQTILCEGRAPSRVPAPAKPERVIDWAEEEFGNCQLGDARLTERLTIIARDFFAQPMANLPQSCGSRAKTKAAYRFLDHEGTTLETLLKPHYAATEKRIGREAVVLAVQDTSSINYSGLKETEGLGPIGTTVDGAQGMLLHGTLAFNLEGTPLGLIDAQCWQRDPAEFGKKRNKLSIEDKESGKWLKSYRAVVDLQKRCPDTMLVSVGDREADIYELFYEATVVHANGPKLLIRAKQDRRVAGEHTNLWNTLEHQPLAGMLALNVPRTPKRVARKADLEIRCAMVTLHAPQNKKTSDGKEAPDVCVYAVLAKEINTSVKEPLEWLLLTTLPVVSFEDAAEKLVWYTKRWGIEVYHKILKSGCRIEERQLCTAERLEACLAIDLVVAWRIYQMNKLAREVPDASAEICFEQTEWKALMVYTNKKGTPLPDKPPTMRDAVRRLASLGGFLGRKCDGEPGTQTLWRGLHRLHDIANMYSSMTGSPPPLGVPQLPCPDDDYG